MAYFNLSLHRSATTSVAKVFKDARHECLDWVGWDFERAHEHLFYNSTAEELLETISSSFPDPTYYGDLPIPLLYDQLLNRYPQASYFIVLRDVHEWATSSYEHTIYTGRHPDNPSNEILTPANRMMFDKYGLLEEARSQLSRNATAMPFRLWSRLYHQHLISVVESFTQRSVPLRLFHLSDPEIGAQLLEYASPGLSPEAYQSYAMPHLRDLTPCVGHAQSRDVPGEAR